MSKKKKNESDESRSTPNPSRSPSPSAKDVSSESSTTSSFSRYKHHCFRNQENDSLNKCGGCGIASAPTGRFYNVIMIYRNVFCGMKTVCEAVLCTSCWDLRETGDGSSSDVY